MKNSKIEPKSDTLPTIDQMVVTKYDLEVKVFPMMCVVENRVNFQPGGNITGISKPGNLRKRNHEGEKIILENDADLKSPKVGESKFAYPLHNSAKMNKFVAKIIPLNPEMTEIERKEKTISIIAKIEELEEAREMFEKAKRENKAAVLTELDSAATDSFICKLGSIPPNCEVNCEFSYFMELKEENISKLRSENNIENSKTVRLHIPMSYKKRFVGFGSKTPELNKSEIPNFRRTFSIEAPNGKSFFGKTIDGENRILVQDKTKKEKWILDSDQLNKTIEDIELYIKLEIQQMKNGEFLSAFEYYPENNEAMFCVNVNQNIKFEDIAPTKKVKKSRSKNGVEQFY